jgi:hypothetical protein
MKDSVEIPFRKFKAPLAPSLPLGGGGGAYDFPVLTGNPDTGNAALSRLGRHSGGAKPLERHQEGGFLQSRMKVIFVFNCELFFSISFSRIYVSGNKSPE